MRFDSDIFISYAHLDNETAIDGQDGWVTNLHRALEVRVAQLLGKKPKIFRDPKLQGNDFFADELVEQLPRTALLVSVFSPRYVKSEWCGRELIEFVEGSAGSGGIKLGGKARVFKVLKTPVPLEKHPEPVQPLLGYEFYKEDPDTGRARELDQVFGPEAQRDFWMKLDDLAHDIAELLEVLEEGSGGAATAPEAPDAIETEKSVVYLAPTTFDLKDEYEAVKRDLKQAGHRVLPESPLPLEAGELEAFVREQLAESRLSVHLVGRKYGIVPEGATESLGALQNDLATELGARGELARLVWVPPGLEADEERQGEFMDKLRSDPRIQQGADLLEVPLEDLKMEIHQRLAPPEKPEKEETAAEESAGAEIYLVCDQRDLDQVAAVEDHLFDQGHEVTLPAFDGDEAEVRQDHEENLRAADAVLVYYGEGNDLWLRRKLRELKKAAGLGREEPWLARAVLVAPPDTAEKTRLRSRDVLILPAGGGSTLEALEPFLAALREGAGSG